MSEKDSKSISFTKYQFQTLIKLVYLGEWMVNSVREDANEDVSHIENFIYSFANAFGLGKYVRYDKDELAYVPTHALEDDQDIEEFRSAYDEQQMWSGLIDAFAERDFFKDYSEQEIDAMSDEDKEQKISLISEKYEKEFSEHGIDNLYLNLK